MKTEKLSPIMKASAIINVLGTSPFEFKSADISSITGINRTTTYRILSELMNENWVIQDRETKNYRIGPTLYHIGQVYCSHNTYENKILEILNDLSAQMKESLGYAVREGDRVISLYEIELYQPYKLNYQQGAFYPMNKGGYGKCLMAYYDQDKVAELLKGKHYEKTGPNTLTETQDILKEYETIRKQGYVISDEEVAPSLVSVGVPVFNGKGEAVSCIAVAFIKDAEFDEKVQRFLVILREGAKQLTKYMT